MVGSFRPSIHRHPTPTPPPHCTTVEPSFKVQEGLGWQWLDGWNPPLRGFYLLAHPRVIMSNIQLLRDTLPPTQISMGLACSLQQENSLWFEVQDSFRIPHQVENTTPKPLYSMREKRKLKVSEKSVALVIPVRLSTLLNVIAANLISPEIFFKKCAKTEFNAVWVSVSLFTIAIKLVQQLRTRDRFSPRQYEEASHSLNFHLSQKEKHL